MLITTSKIIGLPVGAINEKSKIGQVKKLIFDPEDFQLIAVLVAIDGFILKKKMLLSSKDIIEIDKQAIVTQKKDNIVDITEIIKAKKILDKNINIIGQTAITKSKKRLGVVFDILFDIETLTIVKLYIRDFLDERVLSINKVEKINNKAVIFSDDVVQQTSLIKAEGSAA